MSPASHGSRAEPWLNTEARRPTSPASRRAAFTLVESLLALGLFLILLNIASAFFSFGDRSARRITSQLGLQQESRKALVRLMRELQEGMEVLRPAPGSTLPYALFTDKLGRVCWLYLRPTRAAGKTTFELWLYRRDTVKPEPAEVLLGDVARAAFTSCSEGALQINLSLRDGDEVYPLLTTVRLRNFAASEEVF